MMSRTVKNATKVSAIALALGLLAGCATTDEGNLAVRVSEAEQETTKALEVANQAMAKAEAALAAATEAKEVANRAEGLAKAAEFAAERNARKQEQMFKKSMYK